MERDRMNIKRDEMSRITIDIPTVDHKRLKAIAAILGKTMRDIVVISIEEHLHKVKLPGKEKKPNKKTLEAMRNIEEGKNLVEAKDAEDLFKKLGI